MTTSLEREIEHSKYMLDNLLRDEFSISVKKSTHSLAIDFIRRLSTCFVSMYNMPMPVPTISHTPTGSVDFYWQVDDRIELLVNISEYPEREAQFYGDVYGDTRLTIKGKMVPSCNSLHFLCNFLRYYNK